MNEVKKVRAAHALADRTNENTCYSHVVATRRFCLRVGPLFQERLSVNFEVKREFPYHMWKLDMMGIPDVSNMTAFVEGYPRKYV